MNQILALSNDSIIQSTNPQMGNPQIDKLSGVVDLPKDLCGHAYSCFIQWAQDKDVVVSKVPTQGKYSKSIKLHFPTVQPLSKASPFIFLQLTHPNASKPQLRFEYNPAHLTHEGRDYLDVMLQELLNCDSLKSLMSHARFTRVDICRDIMHCYIEDILVKAKWAQISQNWCEKKGNIRMIVLGQKGEIQSKLYDKALELHGEHKPYEMTRIEVCIRRTMTHEELVFLPNPFMRLSLYNVGCKNPPYGKAHWTGFQDSCRMRGTNNAVKKQPKEYHPTLRKALKEQSITWWQQDKLDWKKQWVSALNNAGLLLLPHTAPLAMG